MNKTLPVVLSGTEVKTVLEAIETPMIHALFTTAYGPRKPGRKRKDWKNEK